MLKIVFAVLLMLKTVWVWASEPAVQLGPRPFFLISQMQTSPLKHQLQQCSKG
ncbi:MAG: glycerophosphodiester phosphodiesterase, partial [Betaproteobacteria bacterium]|nr:glycerophosphodiester phosphodiesterase [Betaproteobacteria bacterium]